MALETVISPVCFNCCDNTLVITDGTGDYNATDNVGGWGSPNKETSDVSTSTITLTDPSGNVTTHTATTLPQSSFTLTADDIVSGATTLEDGQYSIVWTLVMSDNSVFSAYSSPYSTCVVENCVTDKVAGTSPDCGCKCDDCSSSVMKYPNL